MDGFAGLNKESVKDYILSLKLKDGSFQGDKWGEVDTRFAYCAVSSLALMGFLDLVDKERTINYILSCRNYDNGFGSQPDAESHGAYVFTALGTLKILGGMKRFDNDKLAYWLGER